MAQTQAQAAPAPDVAPFAPATNSAAAPSSLGANVLQTFTPTLPVYLNITLDRAVMTVDETAVVTVSLYSTGDLTKKQLKLVLDVPNALITTTGGKGKLRWDVPNLSAGQIFQQQVLVRVDKAKKALKQGVVRFTATSNAVGHKALMTESGETRNAACARGNRAVDQSASVNRYGEQHGYACRLTLRQPAAHEIITRIIKRY